MRYLLVHKAYLRDRKLLYTGESLLLACLLHTKGNESTDLEDVWRIMNDHNHR